MQTYQPPIQLITFAKLGTAIDFASQAFLAALLGGLIIIS